ncbi:Ribonuclease [bacterium HR39]|nr:Ribonuclease [bacterium HR39]
MKAWRRTARRGLLALLLGLLLALAALPALAREAGDAGELVRIARELGLDDVDGFVEAVVSVCRAGRLPPRYITKGAARELGWRPGRDLCVFAPGRILGGDRFHNRERRLPEAPGRRWYEADLDHACGRRGPKRLVFSSDRLVFVTVDHYRSFRRVPCPQSAPSASDRNSAPPPR